MKTILTPEEAAAFIGFAVRTLKNWRRLEQGPPWFAVHGKPRYLVKDLEAWVESHAAQSERDESNG
jgi:hypothetical protein